MANNSEVGRLVKAGNEYFECLVPASQFGTPAFGDLVIAEISPDYKVYGAIGLISVEPSGLTESVASAENLANGTITDMRERGTPARLGVVVVGYIENGKTSHLVPPRPPMSLAGVKIAGTTEIIAFTKNRGYLRHILKARSAAGVPMVELLAAHITAAHDAHWNSGDKKWTYCAVSEMVTQLRDDYDNLMNFMQAISSLPAEVLTKGEA